MVNNVHAPATAVAGQASPLAEVLASLRPKQWAKNVMVFAALVFSINQYWALADLPLLAWRSLLAFACFSLLSSGQYLVNDVLDAPRDREHPEKRLRPIAAGRVSPATALVLAGTLITVGLGGAFLLGQGFGWVAAVYVGMMLIYSTSLKHLVIIDVFVIAAGFVARAAGGAVAIGVPISPWLYLCTLLGALFLALTKRRQELVLLQDSAPGHRSNLEQYSLALVDQMINVVTPSTVIAYSVYTFTAEGLPRNHAMMFTIPFVLYGIFRYLFLSHAMGQGGAPEDVLFTDRALLLNIVAWIAVAAAVLVLFRDA